MIQYLRRKLIILCIAALCSLGFWYMFGTVPLPNARFVAEPILLSPARDGQIAEIFVHQGDFVRKGEPLVRLDSRAQDARLQTAVAFLAVLAEAKQLAGPMNIEQLQQKIEALRVRAEGMRKEESVGREHVEAQGLVHVQKTLALRALDAQASSPIGAAQASPPIGAAQASSPIGAAQASSPIGAAQASPPIGAAQTALAKASVRQRLLHEQREARDALTQVRIKFGALSRARVQAERDVTKSQDSLYLVTHRQQSFQSQKYLHAQIAAEAQEQESLTIKAVASAQLAVDTALLIAPIDGRIMMLDGAKGEYVAASKPFIRIQGTFPPDVWVTASFRAEDAPKFSLDMPVMIQTAGKNSAALNGRIAGIETIADALVIKVELVNLSLEESVLVQHNAPVSASVPWWGRLQAFVS